MLKHQLDKRVGGYLATGTDYIYLSNYIFLKKTQAGRKNGQIKF
jgi:hypothetical protein